MPQLGCGILRARARLLQLCPATALARNIHGCHSSGRNIHEPTGCHSSAVAYCGPEPGCHSSSPQYPRAQRIPQLGCGILWAATALARNIHEPTGATALTTPSLHISLYSTVYISRVYTVEHTMQYIYSILVYILQYVLWLQRHLALRFISLKPTQQALAQTAIRARQFVRHEQSPRRYSIHTQAILVLLLVSH